MVIETDKLVNSYYDTIKGLGLEVKKTLDTEQWVFLVTNFKEELLGISFDRNDPTFVRVFLYNIYEINETNRKDVYRTIEKAQEINFAKFVLNDKKDNLSAEGQFFTNTYEIEPDSLILIFRCLIEGRNSFLELMGNREQ